MTKLIALTRLLLDHTYGVSKTIYYHFRKKERLWEPIVIMVSILFLVAMVSVGAGFLTSKIYEQTAPLGQPALILTMSSLASGMAIFVLGFAFVISTFYFSNDLAILIPLPLKPYQVITGKFITILTSEYIISFVVLLPVWIVYSIKAGVGGAYWLSAIPVFLALPIIPIALSSIIVMGLMRFVNLSRKKDLFTVLGSLLFIALIVCLQVWLQFNTTNGGEQEFIERLVSNTNSLVDIMGSKYPPAIWATRAMSEAGTIDGLVNLLILLGVSAAVMLGLLLLGERVFYRSVILGFEVGGSARSGAKKQIRADAFRSGTAVDAVGRQETRNLFRTPVYLLNCMVGFVLFPIMLLGPRFFTSPDIETLLSKIQGLNSIQEAGILVGGCYFLMMASFSSISPTTYSREGKWLWILKTLPLSAWEVFDGKLRASLKIIMLGSLPGACVIYYTLGTNPLNILISLLIGFVVALGICLGSMLIDLSRPLLNWIEPERAVKSNINTMFTVFGGMILLVLLGAGMFWLFSTGMSGALVVALFAFIFVIIDIYLYAFIKVRVERLYGRIEI